MSNPLTHTGACDCGADRCTGFKLNGVHVEEHEVSRKRTTKYVTGNFALVFHGDYVSADEIQGRLADYLDSGLDDRDDLRSWNFEVVQIDEVHGDPEGYDD